MGYTVGKGRPPKHSQFKPGKSGNPDGARRHNPVLKAIKRLTAPEVQEVGSLIVNGSIADLKKAAADPNASVYKLMLISMAMRVIKKGDARAFDTLLNRIIGKVKGEVELSGPVKGPIESALTPEMIADEETFNLLAQAEQRMREMRDAAVSDRPPNA